MTMMTLEHLDEKFEDKFSLLDAKFDQLNVKLDKKFDLIDQRFEQIGQRFEEIDRRFDQVDERFDDMEKRFDEKIDDLAGAVARGFTEVHAELKTYATKDELKKFAEKLENNFRFISAGMES